MITIGVDIAKNKHACCISEKNTPLHQFQFENSREGFLKFLSYLEKLDPSKEKRIGFEATGHYADNFKHFLMTHAQSFMEINPAFLKHFLRSESNLVSKTDKADARAMCRYLSEKPYKPYSPSVYHARHLKEITSERSRLVKHRSQLMMQLRNLLDRSFPEFTKIFPKITQATPLYLLKNYGTPCAMATLDAEDFRKLRDVSRGRISAARFNQLIEVAKHTIGVPSEYTKPMLQDVISHIEAFSLSIEAIEKNIQILMKELNPPLLSIPGLGYLSSAVILGHYGDFSRFASADEMAAFAGMCPFRHQSGEVDITGRMVKRGDAALRSTLIYSAFRVIRYSPTLDAYYRKKRNERKKHTLALVHVAKKLLRIIYTLQTKNILFDEAILR